MKPQAIGDAVKFEQLSFRMSSLTHHYCSRISLRRQSLHPVAAGWAEKWSHLNEKIHLIIIKPLLSSSFTCTEEALPPLGVVVEGPAVVRVLVVALSSAALNVRHLRDVGVSEG